jgi:hypothetical protein
MAKVGDRWISMREAAELAGVSHVTMRRRLHAEEARQPGLIRRPGASWLEFNARALERILSTDDGVTSGALSELAAVQERHERQIKSHLMRIRAAERRMEKTLARIEAHRADCTCSCASMRVA